MLNKGLLVSLGLSLALVTGTGSGVKVFAEAQASTERAETVSVSENEALYNQVIQNIVSAMNGNSDQDVNTFFSSGLGMVRDGVKYTLYDIDGNGVREFIVAGSYDTILDIFTIKDGDLVRLTNSDQPENLSMIGERMNVYITSDGYLNYVGSGGATSHSFALLEIDDSGKKLNLVERFTQEKEDMPNFRDINNGGVVIRTEFDERMKSDNVISMSSFNWTNLDSSSTIAESKDESSKTSPTETSTSSSSSSKETNSSSKSKTSQSSFTKKTLKSSTSKVK